MANLEYKILPLFPEQVTDVERFSTQDVALFGDFKVNNRFKVGTHSIELHAYSQIGQLLKSDYSFKGYSFLATSAGAGQDGESTLTIDPVKDSVDLGYTTGQVKLMYNFYNNLYSKKTSNPQFYIETISNDRTELRLLTTQLPDELIRRVTGNISTALGDDSPNLSYFSDFRLNFLQNRLVIGINISVETYRGQQAVLVKLYEPLPSNFKEKDTCTIIELISDSIAFEIISDVIAEPVEYTKLAEPNFDIDVEDLNGTPSPFLSIDDLLSYPISSSYYELMSLTNESGSALSIDHSDYSNFVHFSSAEERLRNFKYKLQLIETYRDNINVLENGLSSNINVTGSIESYEEKIKGVVNNFDHYDRFLYYESGSYSWPKSNTSRPYILVSSSQASTTSWFNTQLTSASNYDVSNLNSLTNSIPAFIREDSDNNPAITFTHMLGQHFDNIWIYQRSISKRYDADNRLDFGISRDLVGDALRAFGTKVYSSNESLENLFSYFTGQEYTSGSVLASGTHVTASAGSNAYLQPMPAKNYMQEVQKRIYHNLPLLNKSKGTERGLRALINCYGVPNTVLTIRTHGGISKDQAIYLSPDEYISSSNTHISSSLDNIDIDITGSLIPGFTLTDSNTIRRTYSKPTKLGHTIEVGFSPADNENIQIYTSASDSGSFNIDDYIGDPGFSYSSSYDGLDRLLETYFQDNSAYDVKDFVNLIRFFDNTLFKSIRDYIPARATADVGIIIKPNVLSRSKVKLVSSSVEQPEYSQSISLVEITGSEGGMFSDNVYLTSSLSGSTSYTIFKPTVSGSALYTYHNHRTPEYDGEFSGSEFTLTTGELNDENLLKQVSGKNLRFNLVTFDSSFVCGFGLQFFSFPTPSPSVTPTVTPSVSTTNTTTATPTRTPSISTTNTTTATPTPSISTTNTTTATPSVTPTETPVASQTPTPSVTPSISVSPSRTPSVSTTRTATVSPTPTVTPTVTPTKTPSVSTTNTTTATPSVSTTNTTTATPTKTPSVSTTNTRTAAVTPSRTRTPSLTPTVTPTVTPTRTPSVSTTNTATATPSKTPTKSKSLINHGYTVTLYGNEYSNTDACSSSSSNTFYTDTSYFNFNAAIYIYSNSNLYAASGWYANSDRTKAGAFTGGVWGNVGFCMI